MLVAHGLQLNLTFPLEKAGLAAWRQSQAGKESPGRITTARLPPAVRDKPTGANFSSGGRRDGPPGARRLFCCSARWDLQSQGGSRQRELGFTAAWNHPCLTAPPCTLLPTVSSPSSPLPSANSAQVFLTAAGR